jgi:hypothetical protein
MFITSCGGVISGTYKFPIKNLKKPKKYLLLFSRIYLKTLIFTTTIQSQDVFPLISSKSFVVFIFYLIYFLNFVWTKEEGYHSLLGGFTN